MGSMIYDSILCKIIKVFQDSEPKPPSEDKYLITLYRVKILYNNYNKNP